MSYPGNTKSLRTGSDSAAFSGFVISHVCVLLVLKDDAREPKGAERTMADIKFRSLKQQRQVLAM